MRDGNANNEETGSCSVCHRPFTPVLWRSFDGGRNLFTDELEVIYRSCVKKRERRIDHTIEEAICTTAEE